MQISKKVAILFSVVGLAAGTAGTIAFQTHAAGTGTATTTATASQHSGFKRGTPPAAMGAVTAVSGNTITVTDKKSGTSYTVNAGSATIEKFTAPAAGAPSTSSGPAARPAPTTISVSGIAVGDNVIVTGTVSGTTITATKILDGMMMGGFGGFRGRGGQRGQGGTVSAINGNTITLTGKNGTTYTIDASSATVKKVSASSVADIAVGDTLMVNGTTSGTTITAKNIIDGMLGSGKPAAN
jgi:hypothetical protein